jgi:hypothetical protein
VEPELKRQPRWHFEGLDNKGNVFFVEKLGEIPLSATASIPINLIFSSKYSKPSSYVGAGWELPLLETRVVQTDEFNFLLKQPDGIEQVFWRDRKNPEILKSWGGWQGAIEGNSFVAWNASGLKLSFIKGKIAQITSENSTIQYQWNGEKVDSITSNGKTLLKVESNSAGETEGLTFGQGKRIEFHRTERPKIEKINGTNVVAAKDWTLGKVVGDTGPPQIFEFAVDENLNPTVRTSRGIFSWNPSSNQILSDGNWKYNIKFEEGNPNAAIERVNSEGKKEFWHLDPTKGLETIIGADGLKKVVSWYAHGPMMSKIRWIKSASSKENDFLYQAAYDEKGRLIREIGFFDQSKERRTRMYSYDETAKSTTMQMLGAAGVISTLTQYDVTSEAGAKIATDVCTILGISVPKTGLLKIFQEGESGKKETFVYRSEDNQPIGILKDGMKIKYEFDARGRTLKEYRNDRCVAVWNYDNEFGSLITYLDNNGNKIGSTQTHHQPTQ